MMMTKDTNQYFKKFFTCCFVKVLLFAFDLRKIEYKNKSFQKKKIEKKRVQKEYI